MRNLLSYPGYHELRSIINQEIWTHIHVVNSNHSDDVAKLTLPQFQRANSLQLVISLFCLWIDQYWGQICDIIELESDDVKKQIGVYTLGIEVQIKRKTVSAKQLFNQVIRSVHCPRCQTLNIESEEFCVDYEKKLLFFVCGSCHQEVTHKLGFLINGDYDFLKFLYPHTSHPIPKPMNLSIAVPPSTNNNNNNKISDRVRSLLRAEKQLDRIVININMAEACPLKRFNDDATMNKIKNITLLSEDDCDEIKEYDPIYPDDNKNETNPNQPTSSPNRIISPSWFWAKYFQAVSAFESSSSPENSSQNGKTQEIAAAKPAPVFQSREEINQQYIRYWKSITSNIMLDESTRILFCGLMRHIREEDFMVRESLFGDYDEFTVKEENILLGTDLFVHFFTGNETIRNYLFRAMTLWEVRRKFHSSAIPMEPVEAFLRICGCSELLTANHVRQWHVWDQMHMPQRIESRRIEFSLLFLQHIISSFGNQSREELLKILNSDEPDDDKQIDNSDVVNPDDYELPTIEVTVMTEQKEETKNNNYYWCGNSSSTQSIPLTIPDNNHLPSQQNNNKRPPSLFLFLPLLLRSNSNHYPHGLIQAELLWIHHIDLTTKPEEKNVITAIPAIIPAVPAVLAVSETPNVDLKADPNDEDTDDELENRRPEFDNERYDDDDNEEEVSADLTDTGHPVRSHSSPKRKLQNDDNDDSGNDDATNNNNNNNDNESTSSSSTTDSDEEDYNTNFGRPKKRRRR